MMESRIPLWSGLWASGLLRVSLVLINRSIKLSLLFSRFSLFPDYLLSC